MEKKSLLGFVRAAGVIALAMPLLAISPVAGASIITLSTVSSDFGEPFGATHPNDLSATLDFQVSGNTLTLSVTNNTDANVSGNTFDISEVFFNASTDITSLTLTSPLAAGDAGGVPTAPSGWDFFTNSMADGFGNFDYAVKLFGDVNLNDNRVDPGETEVLQFTLSCLGGAVCDMNDFVEPNASGYLAAAKFVNGPLVENSDGSFDPDSAFGTTAIPVPAALWLFGSGLVGLVAAGRRRKH
jgi:hypothetical protein